jgi:hypothetical protein
MSDCQWVASRVVLWSNRGMSYMCATMLVGLWCASVEHWDGGRR